MFDGLKEHANSKVIDALSIISHLSHSRSAFKA